MESLFSRLNEFHSGRYLDYLHFNFNSLSHHLEPSKVVGGNPYPEVTDAFLPSSLRTSHSFALVYSTWSPVSVCGTVSYIISLEDFLGSVLWKIDNAEASPFHYAWSMWHPDFPRYPPHVTNAKPLRRFSYNTPSLHQSYTKSRNINRVSIGCGFHHFLRPD